jgi:DNA-binding response OmpR family regulator
MDDSQQPRSPAPPLLVYQFGGFTLDPARGALSRPTGTEVSLRPKAAEALRHLVHNAGRVVPREERDHEIPCGALAGSLASYLA